MSLVHSIVLAIAVSALFCAETANAQANPAQFTSATRYDEIGRETGVISPDPDGAGALTFLATRTTYDAAGRVVLLERGTLSSWQDETVDPASWGSAFTVYSSIGTEYDLAGRKLTEKTTGSDSVIVALTQYSYDSLGRLECTAVRMNPAAFGSRPARSACTLGAEGRFGPDRITRNVYDAADQLLQIRQAVGTAQERAYATYSYTLNGQIEETIDANGNRARLDYDGFDRLQRWTFPSETRPTAFDSSSPAAALASAGAVNTQDYEEYQYDANGNRVSLRRRDGMELTYEYDALGRMTRKNVPDRTDLQDSHEQDVVYAYDLRGLQTNATFDPQTTKGITTTYDGFGRIASTSSSFIAGAPTLEFVYDRNGNRTEIEYPDGTSFTYAYDGLDRFDTVRRGTNGAALVDQSYNNRGQLTDMYFFTDNADLRFGYDNVGRQDQHIVRGGPAHLNAQWDFTRNPASQIVTENRNTNQYAWGQHVNADRAYYVNGLNQYTQVGADGFCYDANGNLTADGGYAYQYDNENRLVRMYDREATRNCPSWSTGYSGQRLATIIYDPMGRIARIEDNVTSNQTYFLYDGDALVAEYNSSGTVLRRYLHGPVAGMDDPLVWYEGAGTGYENARMMVRDPRGSIILARDRVGTYETVLTYDEYGIPGSGNRMAGADPRFQYTGEIWLEEFGLYHYKARVYSPTLGRFLQADPIGYEDNINLYAYVANDPINAIDPDGQMIFKAIKFIATGGDLAATFGGVIEDFNTVTNSEASAGDRILAGLSLASEALPVSARDAADTASAAARAIRCCFVAGTLVDTEAGLRSIEEIAVGDRIWARDEDTGETALKEVTDLIQRHERVIWEVSLIGASSEAETFETTDDHPWWIAGQGWKRTEELVAGMAVVTRDGRGMLLASVLETDRTDVTYNLTVADFETYFVGEQRVLVHNCPTRRGFSERTKREVRQDNQRAGQGTEHCVDCGIAVERQSGPNRRGQRIAPNRSEIDHDQRLADGGSNDASNGRVRCHECHGEKTARENSSRRSP